MMMVEQEASNITGVRTLVLPGFDAPGFGPELWNRLLAAGETDVVFLTWQWQRAWWETLGQGRLLLIAAERWGEVVAVAPFYAYGGMIYFIGTGDADYLDFIGDTGDPPVLDAMLEAARGQVNNFQGFEFEPVLKSSRTAPRLLAAADRLNLSCREEWGQTAVAPALDLSGQPERGVAAVNKKSLLRHERALRRDGELEVLHLRDGKAILPHLDEFFEQHISRWASTPTPSFFSRPPVRAFYTRLTESADHTGWLRFTRLDWQGRAIAFHFGFCYRGSYLWYKPTFAVDLARRSPGEALLRQLMLAAIDEGAHTFDFGIGDEPFKLRFATTSNQIQSWVLYPR